MRLSHFAHTSPRPRNERRAEKRLRQGTLGSGPLSETPSKGCSEWLGLEALRPQHEADGYEGREGREGREVDTAAGLATNQQIWVVKL